MGAPPPTAGRRACLPSSLQGWPRPPGGGQGGSPTPGCLDRAGPCLPRSVGGSRAGLPVALPSSSRADRQRDFPHLGTKGRWVSKGPCYPSTRNCWRPSCCPDPTPPLSLLSTRGLLIPMQELPEGAGVGTEVGGRGSEPGVGSQDPHVRRGLREPEAQGAHRLRAVVLSGSVR